MRHLLYRRFVDLHADRLQPRSVFARYNVTSESDLADAVERISEYVAEHGAEQPKVEPISPRRQA